MEKKETPKKRPAKPFNGAADGIPFTKTNQPTPEQKKAGWQQWRKERHLTQQIIKQMLGEDGAPTDTLKTYIKSLIINAQMGNAKAIEVISKCMEDDITKVAQVDTDGNDVSNITKVEIVKAKNNEQD